MSNFKGKMYSVPHSSNINKVGWEYDKETKQGVLRIEFSSGKEYDYFPVEKRKWNEYWNTKQKKSVWLRNEIIKDPLIGYEEVTE